MGFIDNYAKKDEEWKDTGIKIWQPNKIAELNYNKILIASTRYASEMFWQLLGLGVKEHDIIVDYVSREIYVCIDDLLSMQIDRYGDFNRVDIIVKYIAIDAYMKDNKEGIEIYKQMQRLRLCLSDEEVEEDWLNYTALIESIKQYGYKDGSCIVCDELLHLMDGAHRVAICMYLGISIVPVKVVPRKFECRYGIQWFWEIQ